MLLCRNTLLCILALGAGVVGQQTTPISSFELQTAGAVVPVGAPDLEGWQSVGGTQVIMPNATPQSCQSPGSGQWCEISPSTVGPASPVVAPPFPATWPFVQTPASTVSEMQLSTTAPTVSSGAQVSLKVDWQWFSSELAGSAVYNDFAQILLIHQPTNTVVTVMYVDTYHPSFAATNTCTSGVTNLTYTNGTGGPQTATVPVPACLFGQPVLISVVAANQGDSSFDSVLFVDNFRWEEVPGLPSVWDRSEEWCVQPASSIARPWGIPHQTVMATSSGTMSM